MRLATRTAMSIVAAGVVGFGASEFSDHIEYSAQTEHAAHMACAKDLPDSISTEGNIAEPCRVDQVDLGDSSFSFTAANGHVEYVLPSASQIRQIAKSYNHAEDVATEHKSEVLGAVLGGVIFVALFGTSSALTYYDNRNKNRKITLGK